MISGTGSTTMIDIDLARLSHIDLQVAHLARPGLN
jgi:hypothetical protein